MGVIGVNNIQLFMFTSLTPCLFLSLYGLQCNVLIIYNLTRGFVYENRRHATVKTSFFTVRFTSLLFLLFFNCRSNRGVTVLS